jgi:hypothetical protein
MRGYLVCGDYLVILVGDNRRGHITPDGHIHDLIGGLAEGLCYLEEPSREQCHHRLSTGKGLVLSPGHRLPQG